MIFIDYLEHPDEVSPEFVRITYAFHLVQDSIPPEFIQLPTEVEI